MSQKTLLSLSKLEPFISFTGALPSETLRTFQSEKQEVIFEFLKRYFASVLDKIDTLKTSKGKANQLKKFYDSLEKYRAYMNSENISYYTRMHESYLKDYEK